MIPHWTDATAYAPGQLGKVPPDTWRLAHGELVLFVRRRFHCEGWWGSVEFRARVLEQDISLGEGLATAQREIVKAGKQYAAALAAAITFLDMFARPSAPETANG